MKRTCGAGRQREPQQHMHAPDDEKKRRDFSKILIQTSWWSGIIEGEQGRVPEGGGLEESSGIRWCEQSQTCHRNQGGRPYLEQADPVVLVNAERFKGDGVHVVFFDVEDAHDGIRDGLELPDVVAVDKDLHHQINQHCFRLYVPSYAGTFVGVKDVPRAFMTYFKIMSCGPSNS